MSDDLVPLGDIVAAYLSTHIADTVRAELHDANVQVSAAEVDLVVELRRRGVADWEQQVHVGPYFVDFVFDGIFGVEVDGREYHQDIERQRDRDAFLMEHGLEKVWHIPALEVLLDAPGVVSKIETQRLRLRRLGPTMASLPVTTRIKPRPVLSRLCRRLRGERLTPPTEREKRDAIDYMRDGPLGPADELYEECERIFEEASR